MRHLLPILLGVLLICILLLSGFSLYNEYQLSSYQKRMHSLMTANLQLKMEQKAASDVMGASTTVTYKQLQVEDIIKRYSQKTNGSISVYYKNMTSDEVVLTNEEKTYYMASLYKVIVTLYVLERVKSGEISLAEKVGSPSLTLEDALIKIITESNNEYAVAIAGKYGWKNIGSYINTQFGIDFDFDGDLYTNVKKMGDLFWNHI